MSAVLTDAANMFETISPSMVLNALRLMITRLRARGFVGIQVPTVKVTDAGRKVRGFPAKSRFLTASHTQFLSFEEVTELTTCFLATNLAQIGPLVIAQGGTPIGGLASSACCDLVLRCAEDAWIVDPDARSSYHLPEVVTKYIVGCRYVDDLLLLSRSLCQSCLESVLQLYPKQVVWENVEWTPSRIAKWLDLHISVSGFSLNVSPFIPTDDNELQTAANSIPPYVDDASCDVGDLINRVSAKYSRLLQLPVSDLSRQRAVLSEVAIWMKRGYRLSFLLKIFTCQGKYPLLTHTAKLCIQQMMSQFAGH